VSAERGGRAAGPPGRRPAPGPRPDGPARARPPAPEQAADAQAPPVRAPGGPPPPAEPPGARSAPETDPAQLVEQDLGELRERAEKADEYLDLARRTQADFENYRKRMARDAAAAEGRGLARLAKELLPAIDNLEHALAAAEQGSEGGAEGQVVAGFKLVHAELLAALARSGIEAYSPLGEAFDPEHDEAMAQRPQEGAAPGTVIEVYQPGYRAGDAVLRPARVVVAG